MDKSSIITWENNVLKNKLMWRHRRLWIGCCTNKWMVNNTRRRQGNRIYDSETKMREKNWKKVRSLSCFLKRKNFGHTFIFVCLQTLRISIGSTELQEMKRLKMCQSKGFYVSSHFSSSFHRFQKRKNYLKREKEWTQLKYLWWNAIQFHN